MILTLLLAAAIPAPSHASCGQPSRRDASWVDQSDYPKWARKDGMAGRVRFTLQISDKGCPTACQVTESSSYPQLDEYTCKLMMDRALFRPVTDDSGTPKAASWSGSFKWALPGAPDVSVTR